MSRDTSICGRYPTMQSLLEALLGSANPNWTLPNRPQPTLHPSEPALRSMYHIHFTSFGRTTYLVEAMLLYLVLTLKGIFHAAIKSVPMEWLGLSPIPHNFLSQFISSAFHPVPRFYSLSFSYVSSFDGASCCFEPWLGLSRVPQKDFLRFSMFFTISEFDRLHLAFGDVLDLLICVFYFSSIVFVPDFDHIFATWLLKTTSRSIPRASQRPSLTDRSPSRTPRREAHHQERPSSCPSFHGPIHHPLQTQSPQLSPWPQPWTNHRRQVMAPMTQPQGQPRLPDPTLQNSSNDQLEAGRGFSRYYQDQWIRLSVYHPFQQIQPTQRH